MTIFEVLVFHKDSSSSNADSISSSEKTGRVLGDAVVAALELTTVLCVPAASFQGDGTELNAPRRLHRSLLQFFIVSGVCEL